MRGFLAALCLVLTYPLQTQAQSTLYGTHTIQKNDRQMVERLEKRAQESRKQAQEHRLAARTQGRVPAQAIAYERRQRAEGLRAIARESSSSHSSEVSGRYPASIEE
jgi:hypothetical protein